LVGYTNAGKSTLLNALTDAGIAAENRLFDTLDTTTRRLVVSETQEALLSDTVGFIRKLPHHLIESFKATLEELTYADLLIHVIDASSSEMEEQIRVVDDMIISLGAGETPRLEAYNKCDMLSADVRKSGENIIEISAVTGQGLEELLNKIEERLSYGKIRVSLRIPYSNANLLEKLHNENAVSETRYLEECIEVDAIVTQSTYGKVKEFEIAQC
jgi:GTP-binding protein HflX